MIEVFYWVLLLIWLVLGIWDGYAAGERRFLGFAGGILQFILFVLLGLAVFSNPLSK